MSPYLGEFFSESHSPKDFGSFFLVQVSRPRRSGVPCAICGICGRCEWGVPCAKATARYPADGLHGVVAPEPFFGCVPEPGANFNSFRQDGMTFGSIKKGSWKQGFVRSKV